MNLASVDPTVYSMLQREIERQNTTINLIASENFASSAVFEAEGSIFSAKYAEGYPRKRYYQGNLIVDEVESLAIERAKEIFGVEYVNVQALSGAIANHAVYLALCQPGDATMGIEIPSGGHLSHGASVTFVDKYYRPTLYKVDQKTEMIDYDAFQDLAEQVKPKIIWIGTSSYSRHYDYPRLSQIAKQVGAYLVTDIAHVAGLVAAKVIPSPVPYADVVTTTTHKTLRGPRGALIMCKEEALAKQIDRAVFPGLQGGPHQNSITAIAVALGEAQAANFKEYAAQILRNAKTLSEELINQGFELVSGGTDNHLMTIKLDSLNFKISGREAAQILEQAGIVANRNSVPYDTHSPFNPGGIRYGTPAMTTCGMKETEMKQIAFWTKEVLDSRDDEQTIRKIRQEVREMRSQFPLPGLEKASVALK
jgi:glycine hydroxymethyltransferase